LTFGSTTSAYSLVKSGAFEVS